MLIAYLDNQIYTESLNCLVMVLLQNIFAWQVLK